MMNGARALETTRAPFFSLYDPTRQEQPFPTAQGKERGLDGLIRVFLLASFATLSSGPGCPDFGGDVREDNKTTTRSGDGWMEI
jgi:hypothetical protein